MTSNNLHTSSTLTEVIALAHLGYHVNRTISHPGMSFIPG